MQSLRIIIQRVHPLSVQPVDLRLLLKRNFHDCEALTPLVHPRPPPNTQLAEFSLPRATNAQQDFLSLHIPLGKG